MALQILPVKKLVVEWRYKPSLRFYSRMDELGLALEEKFPDWERTPLTVEIRDKKRHRRLCFTFNRSFFDSDGPSDVVAEFDAVKTHIESTCRMLEIREFRRVGIRQWFAADVEKPFAAMVDDVAAKFLAKNAQLTAVVGEKIKDVSYVVDLEAPEGWKYNLRLGPMLKAQWFQFVAYELDNFEPQQQDDAESFEKYRKTFPDQFLYIDLDCYRENFPVDESAGFLRDARRRSHEIVAGLINYCKG